MISLKEFKKLKLSHQIFKPAHIKDVRKTYDMIKDKNCSKCNYILIDLDFLGNKNLYCGLRPNKGYDPITKSVYNKKIKQEGRINDLLERYEEIEFEWKDGKETKKDKKCPATILYRIFEVLGKASLDLSSE